MFVFFFFSFLFFSFLSLPHLFWHRRDSVKRVEIVMSEEEDCKGRTKFYNEYGVVRDVLQNHLSEMLALLAMDLPSSATGPDSADSEEAAARLKLLRSVRPAAAATTIVGQ